MAERTPEAMPDERLVAVRPDLRLAVREWLPRDAAAPPFVLLHGLASNARMWDGVAHRLARAGHRVLTVDQRGHGRSDKPASGYDHGTILEDLALLLDRCEVGGAVLVGQSWGGNVVVEAAARWPARLVGVAAIDGGTIDLPSRFPRWQDCEERLAPPRFTGMSTAQLAERMRARHPDWSDDAIAAGLANFTEDGDGTVRPRLSRHNHMQILRSMWENPPSRVHPIVGVPVLLVPAATGEEALTSEKRTGVAEAASALPQARVHWLTGDHDLHAQQPDQVASLLLDAVADGFFM